ncbi:hypothetical protein [Nocardiopsis algeriensis]|uniref:Uncharacterized protein n=1 Tax=Nocardiopsis algeriensis TaxID=1478215 RepID=A0A841IY17_9ACTN|nr:hypothetical protein [Nocardiopsis algeriensis]MBB6122176.1 hypothetical protein [Nocardiopsis algeriensis]
MRRSEAEYVSLARQRLLALAHEHHALTHVEIQARISDVPWKGEAIDPHHVTRALRQLTDNGDLLVDHAPTRGGRDVQLFLSTAPRTKTAVEKAARRKRLLLSRYLGWAQGTPSRPGLIGPAAEQVFHASIVSTGAFTLARPEGGDVKSFLGLALPGPLDSAGFFLPVANGIPGRAIAVPIEIKNLRDWIYPANAEPYQLLDKAARLHVKVDGQVPIAPVFVCRRAHYTTFLMAKQFGFFVIETKRQFIGDVDEDKLNEVRAELWLTDLINHQGADEKIVRALATTFPKQAQVTAERWAVTAEDPDMRDYFARMRNATSAPRRSRILEKAREHASSMGFDGGW